MTSWGVSSSPPSSQLEWRGREEKRIFFKAGEFGLSESRDAISNTRKHLVALSSDKNQRTNAMSRRTLIVHPSCTHRLTTAQRVLRDTEYTRVVVGVAIFNDDQSLKQQSVLIVKRASHASFLPNAWELPGGHVESADATIIHAIFRETLEETGLYVTHINGEFEPFVYPVASGEKTLQLNFAVSIEEDMPITLSPDEHQDYAWVTSPEDVESYEMTPDMKKVVCNALTWAKETEIKDAGTEEEEFAEVDIEFP
jgi:8-oxo-dGTP pyrophosphatase MutT (NUDIX family)